MPAPLQIGNGGTSGTIGTGYVTNNATITFNRSDDYALPTLFDNNLSLHGGPGTLKQIGTGKLIFNYQHVFCTWQGNPNQGLYIGPGSIAETTDYNPVGLLTLDGGTLSSAGGNSDSYQSWVLSGGVTVLSNALTSVIVNSSNANSYSAIQLRDSTVFNVARGATNGIDLFVPAVLTHSYWDYSNWGHIGKNRKWNHGSDRRQSFPRRSKNQRGNIAGQQPRLNRRCGFPVTVQAGGHFGGTGVINRNVTVQSGGFLEPGTGGSNIGTLIVNGNLTLAGTTAMQLNRTGPPSNDLLVVIGALAFGGTLTVSNTGLALLAGDQFKLFQQAGHGHVWIDEPARADGWSGLDEQTREVQTVSLTPTNISLQLSSTSLTLNWPADHTGWRLQSQTNSLNAGLTTNWWNVTGSNATNRWIVPIGTNPSVFFRLIYP
ncbi:MAG: hypothetical protein WDM76_04660 [Limisphaerales bacterium]